MTPGLPLVLLLSSAVTSSPLDAAREVKLTSATVLIRRQVAFSYQTAEKTGPASRTATMKACFPRREEYVLTTAAHAKTHTFDITFCPADSDEYSCLRYVGLPTWTSADHVPGRGADDPGAPARFVFRERVFEFFLSDVVSPTVRSWFNEEWDQVDARLKSAFFELLSVNVRARLGLGEEATLLLATIPVHELRRYEAQEVATDASIPTLCDAPP